MPVIPPPIIRTSVLTSPLRGGNSGIEVSACHIDCIQSPAFQGCVLHPDNILGNTSQRLYGDAFMLGLILFFQKPLEIFKKAASNFFDAASFFICVICPRWGYIPFPLPQPYMPDV